MTIWSNFIIFPYIKDYRVTGKCILSDKYQNLDNELPFINKFLKILPNINNLETGGYIQIGKINFIYVTDNDLIFVNCSDLEEDVLNIAKKGELLVKEFIDKYEKDLTEIPTDLSTFQPFKTRISEIFFEKIKEKPVAKEEISSMDLKQIKIGIVGFKDSGKRTLARMILGERLDSSSSEIDSQIFMKKGRITQKYNALIITIPLENLDNKKMLLKNSDIILIVVDSIFQNVVNTQNHIETLLELTDPSKLYVIANKQDKGNAVQLDVINKMTKLPTIGMSVNNVKYYQKIIEIIENSIQD
jgi:hypothetical protein